MQSTRLPKSVRMLIAQLIYRTSSAVNKLREAMHVLAITGGSGCAIDLGAAPGSWTALLAESYRCVIAVDPGELDPVVLARPNVHHVQLKSSDAGPDIIRIASASATPATAVQSIRLPQHLQCSQEMPSAGEMRRPLSWSECLGPKQL